MITVSDMYRSVKIVYTLRLHSISLLIAPSMQIVKFVLQILYEGLVCRLTVHVS